MTARGSSEYEGNVEGLRVPSGAQNPPGRTVVDQIVNWSPRETRPPPRHPASDPGPWSPIIRGFHTEEEVDRIVASPRNTVRKKQQVFYEIRYGEGRGCTKSGVM